MMCEAKNCNGIVIYDVTDGDGKIHHVCGECFNLLKTYEWVMGRELDI